MKNSFWDFIRLSINCLVFLGLPLILLFFVFDVWFLNQLQKQNEKVFQKHERILADLASRQDTTTYIRGILRNNYNNKNLVAGFKSKQQILTDLFPPIFDLYLVKNNGDIFSNRKQLPRAFLKKLNSATQKAHANYDADILKKHWKMYKAFIGKDVTYLTLFHGLKQVIQVNTSLAKKYFFYNLNKGSGFFAHIHDHPDFEHLGMRAKIKEYVRTHQSMKDTIGLQTNNSPIQRKYIDQVFRSYQQTLKPNYVLEDSYISIKGLHSSALLYIISPKIKSGDYSWLRSLVFIILLVLFVISSFYYGKIVLNNSVFFFSIRWKLSLLFLYACMLPIVAILLTGADYLSKTYQIELGKSQKELEQNLKAIDLQLPKFRNKLEKFLQEYFVDFNGNKINTIERQKDKLNNLGLKLKPEVFFIVNKKGKKIYTMPTRLTQRGKKGMKMFIQLQTILIKRLNNEPLLASEEFKIAAMNSTGGMDVLSILVSGLGKVVEFSFGSNNGWNISLPIKGDNGQVTHLIFLNWHQRSIESLFFSGHKPLEKIVSSKKRFYYSNHNGAQRWPEKSSTWLYIKPILAKLQSGETTSSGHFSHNNHKYVITGIRPKELKENYLFEIQSEADIQKKLRKIELSLYCFSLFCIILSYYLGLILSDKVLKPIKNLKNGILAIEEKKFKHRVYIDNQDEFGELANTFNNMIENLDEVSVASQVQTKLFPNKMLQVGSYSVDGKSIPASQLGGDYYDYFSIDNRYLLALVGDVTGHGVPAALVMAMAKGILVSQLQDNIHIEKAIVNLNNSLLHSLKRRLMMSVAIIWIDTETHDIQQFHAGHPYPVLIQPPNKPSMWEAKGFPLGVSKKKHFESVKRVLEIRDKLFLFSDGLVESFPCDRGVNQYELFMQYLQERQELKFEDLCKDVLSNHPFWLTKEAQPDDFTILAITRAS